MQKILRIVFIVGCLYNNFCSGQTIFSENIGTPSSNTAITSYTGWQNNGVLNLRVQEMLELHPQVADMLVQVEMEMYFLQIRLEQIFKLVLFPQWAIQAFYYRLEH